MNIENTITHNFSRKIAKLYGVNAAIVLGYMGCKIQRSQHFYDGRHWYYETLDSLTRRYPYLNRTSIFEAIKRLTCKNGPLVTGNYNKRGYDRTKWYAFRTESTADILETDPRYFKVNDAVEYGVTKAVLLNNLTHWLKDNQKEKPGYCIHPLSPTTLAKLLPFSRSTIQRALNELVENDGVLVSVTPTDGRDPSKYGFADDVKLTVVWGISTNKGEIAQGLSQTRIPNMARSNRNLIESDKNMVGSHPHNDTMLIDYCLKDLCLEDVCLKRNELVFDTARYSKHTHTESTSKEDSDHKSNLPTLSIQAFGNDSERQGNNVNAALVKPAPIIDAAPILPSLTQPGASGSPTHNYLAT